MKINITLPDGAVKPFAQGTTSLEIAQSISPNLAKQVLGTVVNGQIWDASRPIETDATLRLLTWEDAEGKNVFWHSSAHLMAEAIEALHPNVKLSIGPPIENGFYYDMDFGDELIEAAHLEALEDKMMSLAEQKNIFQRVEVSKDYAINYFKEKNNPYKVEILNDLVDGQITFYKQGNFTDLCKGTHIPHTGHIKAIKLLNIAGAYWRGNKDNKQLTRIYGISFPSKKELQEYLTFLEEAKKRDHQKIGKELGLFTFSKNVGVGLPLWLPKGTILRQRLEQFLTKAQKKAGYLPVVTPHITQKELYITSGHYEKYGKDSFQPIHTPNKDEEFLLKPMNCPHHCEIYKNEPRSYKDLPLRYSEFGTVYRYEQHGELRGLARTRCFTQDDAHIFCMQSQVKDEFAKVVDLVLYVFKALDFKNFSAQVSLRDPNNPDKYIGKNEDWDKAEKAIEEVAHEKGLKVTLAKGEAAFYGPKLDFMVKDALGRSWQLGTVQLDYQLPERFKLEYIGADGNKHRPVMIHRAPFGSIERFVAILIEHTAGKFPLWLAPDQVAVLPISEKYSEYADKVYKTLNDKDIYGFVDHRTEKIGKKIRDAETLKVPYMLIVGEKEVLENKVSVRIQGLGDQGEQDLDALVQMLVDKIKAEQGA